MLVQQLKHALVLAARRSALAPVLRTLAGRSHPLDVAVGLAKRSGYGCAAGFLLSPEGLETLIAPSLVAALTTDINRHIETELVLRAVRAELLLRAQEVATDPRLQQVAVALMQQCINNEYVWFAAEAERIQVEQLRRRTTLPPESEAGFWAFVLLAMYSRPADLLPLSTTVAAFDAAPLIVRAPLREYLTAHAEEQALKATIESFAPIEDDTSRVVRGVYESYPYPRWLRVVEPVPGSRIDLLRQFFEPAELTWTERPFDVLIAGGGTGSKVIQAALGFGERARILAIDLSKTSIAYAMRMARRYGVADRIRFLQMDILDLPKLDRQFDVVECTGVLHHMNDTTEGGRALVARVRPGGAVHFSLYSELSRREVVRQRSEHGDRLRDADADAIREYRYRLMREQPEVIEETLPLRADFFDLNRCRDLLFHPSERRFTIPQLRTLLDAMGVEFRGFQLPGLTRDQYWTVYPGPEYRCDLDRWWAFEQAHPAVFEELYETWGLKRT